MLKNTRKPANSEAKEESIINKNKELIILISAIMAIAVCSSLILRWSRQKEPLPYSSYSTHPLGVKGAYLLLEKLDFAVARHQGAPEDIQPGSVLIVFEPQFDYSDNTDKLKQLNRWVYNGNTMVIAGDYQKYFTYSIGGEGDEVLSKLAVFKIPPDGNKVFYDQPFGRGSFRLVPDAGLFLNGSLRIDGTATRLVSAFWNYHDRLLLFDEPGHSELFEKNAEWKDSPLTLLNTTWQFILLQVVIGLMVLLFFTNRRLGLPVTYHEEAAREENEDVRALAGLMERADQYNDALLLYYQEFEKEAAIYFKSNIHQDSDLLKRLWKEYQLKHYEKLKDVLDRVSDINRLKKQIDSNEVCVFQSIDMLREEIKKNE